MIKLQSLNDKKMSNEVLLVLNIFSDHLKILVLGFVFWIPKLLRCQPVILVSLAPFADKTLSLVAKLKFG